MCVFVYACFIKKIGADSCAYQYVAQMEKLDAYAILSA